MNLLERLAASDPQLTHVTVPRSVGLRDLATAMEPNTTLATLDLAHGIGAEGVHELSEMLGRNNAHGARPDQRWGGTARLSSSGWATTASRQRELVILLRPWSATARSQRSP